MTGISWNNHYYRTLICLAASSLCSLEDSIKFNFRPPRFILVFDAPAFARLSDQRRCQCSGGPEGHEPAPHFLNGDNELVDVGRIFNEQVGASQNSSCRTEQEATVYHLWKIREKKILIGLNSALSVFCTLCSSHLHTRLCEWIPFWGTSVSQKHWAHRNCKENVMLSCFTSRLW